MVVDPIEAESAVKAFYDELGIDRDVPFDPNLFFLRLKDVLIVEFVDHLPDGMNGNLWYCEDRGMWIMEIARGLDPLVKRATMAHELGELLLHFAPGVKPQPSIDGKPTGVAWERAADLLGMPMGCPDLLTEHLFKEHGWAGMNTIARCLRMPSEMVALRIGNLTHTSVAVVLPDNTVLRAGPWDIDPFDEEIVRAAQYSPYRAGESRLVVR